ncbi:zinc ribbon domain-containing protein [uncultured Clostridium sp.]|uniref:zinc ribbon domain-containing protein n=1 Tax=uncultured Clostridium sp. TaxID=59620 RepID=UPI0025D3BCAE|nr:zinc ribbon domain-containing protein [uncultured Clostridium sp.]
MIFIGGISSGMKQIEYLKTVICNRCGAYGRYQVYMTYMYFSFFFIPLFKWNRRYYVKMSCCNAVYELNPEIGRMLLRGADVEIRDEDLKLCREGNGNPWEQEERAGHTYGEQNGSNCLPEHSGKKCPNCGYEAAEDFSYCPKCGSRLED